MMKRGFVAILLLIAFAGVADSATKSKINMKKQVTRVRCQPGYMFERGNA